MPHLAVHKNKNGRSKAHIPFLLDIQSDVLEDLATRVVVPLHLRKSLAFKPMTRLMPEFEIDGHRVVMLTPQLAGISRRELGAQVATLSAHRGEILAALDLLVTGF